MTNNVYLKIKICLNWNKLNFDWNKRGNGVNYKCKLSLNRNQGSG